ncbi:hypothetical protein Aperf_G00000059988 [Anoplocephala perfoliata]
MDIKNFVFLLPFDGLIPQSISWKVATPSMRIEDCISEALLKVTDRRIYVHCVAKKNVPQYVTWNNCDSIKYTKGTRDVGKYDICPRIAISGCKKRAPPPPSSVTIRRHKSRNFSEESLQISHQDIATNTDLEETIPIPATNATPTNSLWSLSDGQALTTVPSAVTIHAMEYPDESDHYFNPKLFTKWGKENYDRNSLSAECKMRICPAVKLGVNSGISPLLKTSPVTFTPFHVPNFEKHDSPKVVASSSPEEPSTLILANDYLRKAKTSLRSANHQKLASIPLRKADEEHRPTFLSSCDRSQEKDWNGRFWCVDSRSRILNFMVQKEGQC